MISEGSIEWRPVREEISSRRPLTLHAESVGAVVGLEHRPIAVLPSVLGRGVAALPPPPLGALGATGRPLGPVGPATVNWGAPQSGRERGKNICSVFAAVMMQTSPMCDKKHSIVFSSLLFNSIPF